MLSHTRSDTSHITALIRSLKKVALLSSVGVTAAVGTNGDFDMLASLASTANVILACANADYLHAARTIFLGLKKRHEQIILYDPHSFLLCSGTGADSIYSNLYFPMMESLPKTQPHREADLEVIVADQGGCGCFLCPPLLRTDISPSTIYDIANTPVVSLGVQNPYSKQIPRLIMPASTENRATDSARLRKLNLTSTSMRTSRGRNL
ncbi:hypothetical protein DEU56DRAFT_895539 [Suillus clintonianus]|uniref:uncharacterized protein n=1 Tax=Suillus clintonianus TaxID=1904413 RepID=UPI001B866EFC|nr:uncharacterized protein DEU56DRAFT_895539 [Suillus clintonianus]KAG2118305.1 hypothetical protein DEU56DRAFT_895539 [Suillus clintonianus]